MDSINTERSYTEYEVTEPTTDFAIGFDNYSGEDKDAIHVTLDGVNLDDLNYTVVRKNAQIIEVTPAIESGVVRLQRETYIDQAFHTFTAGALFSPKSMDENFAQIRRSQQEVNDGFTFLAENTNGVVAAADAATARANAAADRVEDTDVIQLQSDIVTVQGDVSQLQTDVQTQSLDTGITTTAKFGGVERSQADKNSDTVSIKDFGLVGDGVTDDTAAAQLAIDSGESLHWGNTNDTYLITDTITSTAVRDVFWRSNGASINFLPTTQRAAIFDIELDGNNFTLDNKLKFDGNKKAVSGVKLRNTSDIPSNVLADNIEVTRCYRADQSITGGDGIYIEGLLDAVVLNNPRVVDIGMAAGAGIKSSQGISGITVVRKVSDRSKKPRAISINNPYIEDVYSDDLDYTYDQDGIKVFTDHSQDSVILNETTAVISGGIFKNCLGRSIKSQVEHCIVSGGHFIRTKGFNRGYGNPEIDFQVGGGTVSNIIFSYDTSKASTVVACNAAQSSLAASMAGLATINGVRGYLTNLTERLFSVFSIGTPSNAVTININNIIVSSDSPDSLDYILQIQGEGIPCLNISNVSAPLSRAVSRDVKSSETFYTLTNIENTLSTPCESVKADTPYLCKVSALNCKGFIPFRRIRSADAPPTVQKTDGFVSSGHPSSAGLVRPINLEVGAGATVDLGLHGYSTGVYLLMLSISASADSQAVLAVGGGVVNLLTPSNTITVRSEGSETNDFVVFVSSNRLMLENTTTTGRVVTGLVVG